MINVRQFRNDFPALKDSAVYPDASINYWIAVAGVMLNQARWGASAIETWPNSSPPALKLFDLGVELFVAHNLALDAQGVVVAATGAIPSVPPGLVSSKSVGPVSVSYDTGVGVETDAGHWNSTLWGRRFIRLARMLGAGPIQSGVDVGYLTDTGAWQGPIL